MIKQIALAVRCMLSNHGWADLGRYEKCDECGAVKI